MIFLLFPSLCAFYVPGVSPTDYKENDRVSLHVNALSSMKKSVRHAAHIAVDSI